MDVDKKITQDGKTGKKLLKTVNYFTDYLFGKILVLVFI